MHSLNEIRQNGKLNSMVYYINDGVFGSFLNNFFESTVHRPLTLKLSDAEVFTSTVWGPTCDCNDKVKIFKFKFIIGKSTCDNNII